MGKKLLCGVVIARVLLTSSMRHHSQVLEFEVG